MLLMMLTATWPSQLDSQPCLLVRVRAQRKTAERAVWVSKRPKGCSCCLINIDDWMLWLQEHSEADGAVASFDGDLVRHQLAKLHAPADPATCQTRRSA